MKQEKTIEEIEFEIPEGNIIGVVVETEDSYDFIFKEEVLNGYNTRSRAKR